MTSNDTDLNIALWWVERWISGSMDDPDWDYPEGEEMGVEKAFETIQSTIGNDRARQRELWRYLSVSEREAARIEAHGTLHPFRSPFQSFTTSSMLAASIGADLGRPGEVSLLVRIEAPGGDIMFGLEDLMADDRAASTMNPLDHWHHQDEIVVRVAEPMKVLECRRILDWDAELEGNDSPRLPSAAMR